LRDFLSLSKKVKLTDFVFRQIIWFAENDPVNSPEAMKKLSTLRHGFTGAPDVNASFYSLLDTKLKKEFTADQECSIPAGVEALDFYPELKRTVRRVALWIQNNKKIISDPEMPSHEILMFEAAFCEFQFLCDYFLESKNRRSCEINFEEALKLNFEILNELMVFLSEYYLSE